MDLRRVALLSALLLATGVVAAAAQAPDGQALYRENCRSCHGANGVPPERAREQYQRIPTFADSSFFAHRSDDSLLAVLRRGAGRDMKSFTSKLTPEQMRAVVQYIRTLARRSH